MTSDSLRGRETERENGARRGGQKDVRGAGRLSFPPRAPERFALLQWSWRTACLKETSLARREALLQQRISNYELFGSLADLWLRTAELRPLPQF